MDWFIRTRKSPLHKRDKSKLLSGVKSADHAAVLTLLVAIIIKLFDTVVKLIW